MCAAWHCALHFLVADNPIRVLRLPTARGGEFMATGKSQYNTFEFHVASLHAVFTAGPRARVAAAFHRAGAWLKAFDGCVDHVRMTPARTRMATDKPLVAQLQTATIRSKLDKMIR